MTPPQGKQANSTGSRWVQGVKQTVGNTGIDGNMIYDKMLILAGGSWLCLSPPMRTTMCTIHEIIFLYLVYEEIKCKVAFVMRMTFVTTEALLSSQNLCMCILHIHKLHVVHNGYQHSKLCTQFVELVQFTYRQTETQLPLTHGKTTCWNFSLRILVNSMHPRFLRKCITKDNLTKA